MAGKLDREVLRAFQRLLDQNQEQEGEQQAELAAAACQAVVEMTNALVG